MSQRTPLLISDHLLDKVRDALNGLSVEEIVHYLPMDSVCFKFLQPADARQFVDKVGDTLAVTHVAPFWAWIPKCWLQKTIAEQRADMDTDISSTDHPARAGFPFDEESFMASFAAIVLVTQPEKRLKEAKHALFEGRNRTGEEWEGEKSELYIGNNGIYECFIHWHKATGKFIPIMVLTKDAPMHVVQLPYPSMGRLTHE